MKISPKKPHFFKPILPGFKQGIKIPKGFLKYLKRHDQYEHAILRRADKKWRVKVNGRRLEGGWEKFAEQHDLQLRDMLVFRHEGDMEFEVSIFDFNQQCDREYEEEPKAQNVEETSKKFESKEATTTHEPLGCSHFECTIRPYCLKYDYLCLPKHFVLANNLTNKKCDLIIRDERQRSWNLGLTSCGIHRVNLGYGWHEFCVANDLKEGDDVIFEVVITNGEKPIWQFHKAATHKPFGCSHFVFIVKPYCLSKDVLCIPKKFALANDLFNIKKRDLIVRDEKQRSWNVTLRSYCNCVYLRDGWKKIRDANCLEEGDHVTIVVVTGGEKPIWQFHSKPIHNIKSSKKASSLAEATTHKPFGRSHFVFTVKPYCLSKDVLCIPKKFALENGLFNMEKRDLIVRDERQRSWNVLLRSYCNCVYLRDGWNKIRDANCLKEGDHITFLVVTGGENPIWQFHINP